MSIIHGNEEKFNEVIQEGIILVDFFAEWCGPCKMLGPVLEELASERGNIQIVKMDVDQNTNLAKTYGIMSVPTLLLFQNGQLLSKKTGYMPKEMIWEWIEDSKK